MKKHMLLLLLPLLLTTHCKKEAPVTSGSTKSFGTPVIPNEISFAGELFPMDRADVKEALEYDFIKNAYWHSNTLLIIKRANRYFPIIEKILKEENVPDDLKYLAVIESNLDPIIESPAHAKGFWQFLKETGREYGLEINQNIDERSHLEKSTRAACRYLTYLKKETGTWSLAAAAYNTGLGNIRKEMRAQGLSKGASYFDFKLNPETGRYMYRMAALKYILLTPKNYGFDLPESELHQTLPTRSLSINTDTNWIQFAKKNHLSFKELSYYNPWIKGTQLRVKKNKSYLILLPE